MEKPLLIYDGDCGFCRGWVERWRRRTGESIDYAPYQEVAEKFSHISREKFAEAVHLIEPDGQISRGAEAVFRLLALGGNRFLLSLYLHVPLFGPVSEWVYQVIARHRGQHACTLR